MWPRSIRLFIQTAYCDDSAVATITIKCALKSPQTKHTRNPCTSATRHVANWTVVASRHATALSHHVRYESRPWHAWQLPRASGTCRRSDAASGSLLNEDTHCNRTTQKTRNINPKSPCRTDVKTSTGVSSDKRNDTESEHCLSRRKPKTRHKKQRKSTWVTCDMLAQQHYCQDIANAQTRPDRTSNNTQCPQRQLSA